MDLEKIKLELKERVSFYETRYEFFAWDLSDEELNDFLVINNVRLFKGKNPTLFFRCMIDYFDYLFDEAMSDNSLRINKELLVNRLYYLQIIFDNHDFNASIYDITSDLNEIYELNQKTKPADKILTKK